MTADVLRQMRDRLSVDMKYAQPHERISGDEPVYRYKKPIPDDLWLQCPACRGVVFRETFEEQNSVCPLCGHHYRIDAAARIRQVTDAGSFVEWDKEMTSDNPIDFQGYPEKIAAMQKKTGLADALVSGQASIGGIPCCLAVMDSRFMMGSMGSVVGEKLIRLFERARVLHQPVIVFTASGGARMQEGIVSLMQMASTSAAVAEFQAAGLLYVSVLTDPTTGGVTASFASLGDILISEPGTLIGFAGRRVIEGTIAEDLPAGFQRAEFLLEHGFLDLIVPRSGMRRVLADLLRLHQRPSSDLTAGLAASLAEAAGQPEIGRSTDASQHSGSQCLDLIRHRQRPVLIDYLPLLFEDIYELHGDRQFRDDPAIWAGLARLGDCPVTVIGHRKGHHLEENQRCQFGMPHPEGYRKALRLMKQAEKFGRPIISFIDTPGAYCGVGAEERGQGEAIARNLCEMARLRVPVLVVVLGEGGSGGALAIGAGDELAMLSHALYSVISPRGFASLLWKDPSREREAADSIHITAGDLQALGICDAIIQEPGEGAHTDLRQTAEAIRSYLITAVSRQLAKSEQILLDQRQMKFRRTARYHEPAAN
ncbi:MAG: acetyl-CoA carboxylase carboxyltransferase subunit alpha [Eubacteriales bacterium]|nr:acetyl-CoA carboxylase carboxyltransferase subunit alpha [Eubacteriales bacterium]